jgi:hypothetical protein
MSTPSSEFSEIELSDDMKRAVNTAFETRKPIVIAYVDENGAPQLSFRGSTQAYSDTQLAIWVRNPEGRILESIAKNPAVALVYGRFEPESRDFMIFRGRARIENSEAVRNQVYENAHEFERKQDEERKGSALIIDLDSVDGFFGGERLMMRK